MRTSLDFRNTAFGDLRTRLAGCRIRIYSGTAPANIAAALSGNTLLAEFTGASPFSAAAPTTAQIVASSIAQVNAAASGTATFCRIFRADGTTLELQLTVTATGGGGDVQLANTTLTAGLPTQITSAQFDFPEGT